MNKEEAKQAAISIVFAWDNELVGVNLTDTQLEALADRIADALISTAERILLGPPQRYEPPDLRRLRRLFEVGSRAVAERDRLAHKLHSLVKVKMPTEVDDLGSTRAALIKRRDKALGSMLSSSKATEDIILLSHAIAWLHWAQEVSKEARKCAQEGH